MANAERQTSGIGPGSKDQSFYSMAIPLPNSNNIDDKGIKYPFEIDRYRDQIFEVFEKLVIIRQQLERSTNNPSVTESQVVGIEKSMDAIDEISMTLLEIPKYLSLVFNIDK